MRVRVNGEERLLPPATTVAGLLQQLGVSTPRVAVERNREIVPKARYADTRLADGDDLEVVEFVGGG
ncbi:MAG TPA: sulfur carrier protein ThiS [Thermoanaerobaculia bacterium]